MKKVLLSFLFTLLVVMPFKTWAQWETEFVDTSTTDQIGDKCDIALDASGNPHISYQDYVTDSVKYAYWNGSEWQIESLQEGRGETSISLDYSGNPHIAYRELSIYGDVLWYTWWNGANWQSEIVDGDAGYWNSIACDSDGYPHIAYTKEEWFETGYLGYAFKDGTGWHTQIVDSIPDDEFDYSTMALDNSNHPHISYYDNSEYDLKYAYWDGESWHIEIIDSVGQVGKYPSIALNSLSHPCIAYMDKTNYAVKYAKWSGSAWDVETVEQDVGLGFHTSLALDGNDIPLISSASGISGDLRFAYRDDSDWVTEVADNDVRCEWLSIAIDNSGHCQIAYFDAEFQEYALKYAKRLVVTGLEESTLPSDGISLLQNYPNPFNSSTTISYRLPRTSKIVLKIHNHLGQEVRTLVNTIQISGSKSIVWDGKDNHGNVVSTGIYFYTILTKQDKYTRKMLLVR